jgi:hypothetical protein
VKCQHGIAEADDTQICENTMRCWFCATENAFTTPLTFSSPSCFLCCLVSNYRCRSQKVPWFFIKFYSQRWKIRVVLKRWLFAVFSFYNAWSWRSFVTSKAINAGAQDLRCRFQIDNLPTAVLTFNTIRQSPMIAIIESLSTLAHRAHQSISIFFNVVNEQGGAIDC